MAGIAANFLSPTFLIYITLVFIVSNGVIYVLATLRPKAFPPGPRGLPGLGNLLQLNRVFPYLTYVSWSKYYGDDTPLGVKMGSNNVVVLNSGRLVRELFEKRGAVYSHRPWSFMVDTWLFKNDLKAAILHNYSPWLTRWRKEFNMNFSPTATAKLRPILEAETARFLVKIVESPGVTKRNLEDIIVGWVTSVPCLGAVGRRPDSMIDHGFELQPFRHQSDEYSALLAPNVGDLFPFLRSLPNFFGIAQWKERAQKVREEVFRIGEQFLNTAREQRASLDAGKKIAWESVVARMLKEQREKKDYAFTDIDMGNTAFHIVTAAMNTSLAVFSTMLVILAKYPELQQRIRNEILEVSEGGMPKAADVSKLKYTEAFWNETHRWRPVAPQAVPHATAQDDVYNGHRIPKGTTVLINVWRIGHSEEDFEEPDKFIPERWLRHPFGMRCDEAHDPAHLEASMARVTYDFGAGRRICPGMHIAKQNLILGLAKVLWTFDIRPPEGQEIDLSLDGGFVQEVALHPKSLNVVLTLRDGHSKEDVLDHYYQAYEGEAEMMGWEGGLFR